MKIASECKDLLKAIKDTQLEIQPPKKDSHSDMYGGYSYISLGKIIEHIHPIANKHGLVIMQSADVTTEEQVTLHTVVAHVETGQQLATTCLLPLERQTAQGVGSAITYMRRYQLMSIFMLAAEDDDGEASQGSPKTIPARPSKVSGQPARPSPGTPPDKPSAKPGQAAQKPLTAEYVIAKLNEAYGPNVEVVVNECRDFMNNHMTPAQKQICHNIIDRKKEAKK